MKWAAGDFWLISKFIKMLKFAMNLTDDGMVGPARHLWRSHKIGLNGTEEAKER